MLANYGNSSGSCRKKRWALVSVAVAAAMPVVSSLSLLARTHEEHDATRVR